MSKGPCKKSDAADMQILHDSVLAMQTCFKRQLEKLEDKPHLKQDLIRFTIDYAKSKITDEG